MRNDAVNACENGVGGAWFRINPLDEEGKTRSPEKMTELVHDSHQAHTRKALKALKVTPPSIPAQPLLPNPTSTPRPHTSLLLHHPSSPLRLRLLQPPANPQPLPPTPSSLFPALSLVLMSLNLLVPDDFPWVWVLQCVLRSAPKAW